MTTTNAVLMLVFNRPDVTEQVFNAIREAKPPRLYVAADGPRPGRADDVLNTEQVRRVFDQIDWPCELVTRFQTENLGCRDAVASAITWFFQHEEQGIVIEDDVLPTPAFFQFCDTMLERYKHDERVFSVVGNNLVQPWYQSEQPYFFSNVFFVWGWASWRRAWAHYDVNMGSWPNAQRNLDSLPFMPAPGLHRRYWRLVFDLTYRQQIATCWDHQWTYTHWAQGALAVTPAHNLIKNIGFGMEATHTSVKDPVYIKRLAVNPNYRVDPRAATDAPQPIPNPHYYQAMSTIVLDISLPTLLRLSLRRWPALFSALKSLSNRVRAFQRNH